MIGGLDQQIKEIKEVRSSNSLKSVQIVAWLCSPDVLAQFLDGFIQWP
jgi:hypothetical protein